ncbi:NADH dehydrogenase ubiquinone Fe-S protein 4 [Microvirga pakistanensis]|uniref:NADH dehydrogenase ubiquinone Fe-S protein 4 n=1 Tax=Microvirga pakistanensis TaxID=1682650 RepID=UPI00106D4E90|nr:NADH dehydrogenase ubiquinone Fe-S protein 4 [Microvirga pakistanensis]
MNEHIAGIGHNNPPQPVCPPWLAGAEARIARRERAVTTSGRARTHQWVLRFERRSPPVIEPLMGWTSGDDTLATQVEVTFDTLEEALSYAERQGLSYRIQNEPLRETSRQQDTRGREINDGPSFDEDQVRAIIWLTSLQAAYGRCELSSMPDLEKALVHPAAVFADPDHVVRHPLLSLDCKREILWRWAWDEYLVDLAAAEGMADGPPSRLDEVRSALVRLGHDWRPHPAAPAAFVVRYEVQENALAA